MLGQGLGDAAALPAASTPHSPAVRSVNTNHSGEPASLDGVWSWDDGPGFTVPLLNQGLKRWATAVATDRPAVRTVNTDHSLERTYLRRDRVGYGDDGPSRAVPVLGKIHKGLVIGRLSPSAAVPDS